MVILDLKQLKDLSLRHVCDLNMAYTLRIKMMMIKAITGVAISVRATNCVWNPEDSTKHRIIKFESKRVSK